VLIYVTSELVGAVLDLSAFHLLEGFETRAALCGTGQLDSEIFQNEKIQDPRQENNFFEVNDCF